MPMLSPGVGLGWMVTPMSIASANAPQISFDSNSFAQTVDCFFQPDLFG